MLYLCDRCRCISFESNTPLRTKNFTLTYEGAPQPSCPGCLQATSADLREHICETLGASFVTALNSCPFCRERLDVGPSFPSSVADYLRRTKASNKLNTTFDYESELFVPVADGEFVLINNGSEAVQLVLPRQTRFAAPRDFYEFYQDFYHCPQPNAGEVQVIEPAAAVRTGEGWKLQAAGVLEVIPAPPTKKVAAAAAPHRADIPTEDKPEPAAAATNEPVAPCNQCGTLIESRYTFCWKCGNSLTSGNRSSLTRGETPKEIEPPVALALEDDDEQTVQHERRSTGLPIFSRVTANRPQPLQSGNGSVLKLLVVAVIGLVMVSLGVLLLTRSSSSVASVTAAQPLAAKEQSDVSLESGQAAPEVATDPEPQRTPSQPPEDYELNKLREMRIAATRSERSEVLRTLARTEKTYPNDYRFPYERAKLAIKEHQRSSHDEAFAALALAVERAIHSGKAREMLENLQKDGGGDFQKLSHGHQEWAQLQAALKSKDARVLNAKMGL
jgi:hypothetical protein